MTTEPAYPSREDLPEGVTSKTVQGYGVIEYRDADGHLHNPIGPAVIWPDKATYWLVTGRDPNEREDWWFTRRSWWLHGQLHRTNGPAIEWVDGTVEYWVDGFQLSDDEFRQWYPDQQGYPAMDNPS